MDLCLETKITGDNDDKIMTIPVRNCKVEPLPKELGAFSVVLITGNFKLSMGEIPTLILGSG